MPSGSKRNIRRPYGHKIVKKAPTPPPPPNPRRLALGVLLRMSEPAVASPSEHPGDGAGETETEDYSGGYSNILVASAIRRTGIDGADRALFTRLVNGVTERRITLDYVIGRLSSRPVRKLDPDVLNILRLGLYQLIYLDRIPDHAALNETVMLAKQSGRGFVNAILRSFTRLEGGIPLPVCDSGSLTGYSIRYSLPEHLCEKLISVYGAETAERIFGSYLHVPPLTLRVNTLRTTREELTERLVSGGFRAEPTAVDGGIRVASGSGLPGCIETGDAYVQDEASQLCIAALDPQPGEKILDACAAPGTKSFTAALRMENRGHITACDIHPSKLPLISDAAARLGITVTETVCRDSSQPLPACDVAAYDRVLCDVPCSGLGVISKKPEIRYRAPGDTAELPRLQYAILDSASRALRSGGTLIYSTCTILPEENGDVIDRFLAAHTDFTPCPFEAAGRSAPDGRLTLLPGETDGFFIAKLRKA